MNLGISMIAAATILGVGTLYGLSGITVVNPGEVGIQVKQLGSNRGIQEEVLRTGTRWVDPIQYDVIVYNYQSRQYTEGLQRIETQTKDGQPVLVDVSLEVSLDPAIVPNLHENVGKDYYDEIVYPALRSAIRDKVPSEESEDIYTSVGRQRVQTLLQDVMIEKFKHRGVDVIVNLRDINFTNAAFIASLEMKAEAAQRVIIEERHAEAAENTAIKMANLAEGEKQKRIKAAEADKAERVLKGEGDRLEKEETAKGNLAMYMAEAKGIEARRLAYAGPGGEQLVSIAWAENMGPNVKVYGIPTGSPGTTNLMDLNGMLGGAFKGVNPTK